jgi:hypothetical protein
LLPPEPEDGAGADCTGAGADWTGADCTGAELEEWLVEEELPE